MSELRWRVGGASSPPFTTGLRGFRFCVVQALRELSREVGCVVTGSVQDPALASAPCR